MISIKKHIPNAITCMNLLSGSVAVFYAFMGNFTVAFAAVLIAGVFDFCDGLAARALKAYSPMGKELDSLADMVSFGLAPGAVAFSLLSQSIYPEWVKFAGFIIPVFSALRLAKFNIDENQTKSFIGLPTPSNAFFWVGMAFAFPDLMIDNPWLVLLLVVVFSGLLVAKIPMFSLKFSNLQWSKNKTQYIFLAGCIALLIIFGLDAFAPIIVWYLVVAVLLDRLLK